LATDIFILALFVRISFTFSFDLNYFHIVIEDILIFLYKMLQVT